MKSLIIGIARTGKPNNYLLNEDTKYISMCGNKPEVSFSIGCEQDEFINQIGGLRYDDPDPGSSAGAINFFQNLSSQILKDLQYLQIDKNDPTPLHIRLVTTPFELAQIPFEFALTPANIAGDLKVPLLANPERTITFTREVRQKSEAIYVWPYRPRILFAWAQPDPNATVPFKEHTAVLEGIVTPLAKPEKDSLSLAFDTTALLKILPDASAGSIKKEIAEGIKNKMPYTHIHILAHGGKRTTNDVTEFCLLLCKDGKTDAAEKIDGKTLAEAIVPADNLNIPTVVSLSVCDSGHTGNTILPSGSLVYQLHNNGIPCVFASQFPLTQSGSVILTEILFEELINACDPRIALYKSRMALAKEQSHDWASLVAYARFPEDINQQLQDAQLKIAFSQMKTTNAWIDHVFKHKEQMTKEQAEAAFNELAVRIEKSVTLLAGFLNASNGKSTLLTRELKAEHLGLLGSCYKRKAEFLFRLIDFNPASEVALKQQSLDALKQAMNFYKSGFDANADSHWNAMQYLSLKAVTSGSLKDEKDIWTVIKYMAKKDEENGEKEEDRIWAWGTLAELYMLQVFIANEAMPDTIAIAKNYMNSIASAHDRHKSAKESTARQFERYMNWWPGMITSPTTDKLKTMATELRNILPEMDKLI